MTNSYALYKSINLDKSTTKDTKSTVTSAGETGKLIDKGEICSISFSDDENFDDSWDNNREANFKDEHYKEKLMSLLNKEFVQVGIYLCINLILIINNKTYLLIIISYD